MWTSKDYPMARYKPNRYSWVNVKNNLVSGFSLKNLPLDYRNPRMIIGNFTFKNEEIANELVQECFKTADRFNSEIYLDSVIQIALELGYDVSAVNLDNFFAVGTQDELNTYLYYSTFRMSKNFAFDS